MSKRVKTDKNYESLFLLFASITFIDRLAKLFLFNGCFSIFCIKRAVNYGSAFGLMQGMNWLFISVAITVLFLIALFINDVNRKMRWAFVFLAAGTFANLIDRMFFGYVIDLFSIAGSSSFNIADLSNLLGAVLLVIGLFKQKD